MPTLPVEIPAPVAVLMPVAKIIETLKEMSFKEKIKLLFN